MITESLRSDIIEVGDKLKEVARLVIAEGISNHPLFIASQDYIELGKPLFDKDSFTLNWFFNATILEDFIKRNLIRRDKVEEFKRTYGDPAERACIFVVHEEQGQFIFVPYGDEDLL